MEAHHRGTDAPPTIRKALRAASEGHACGRRRPEERLLTREGEVQATGPAPAAGRPQPTVHQCAIAAPFLAATVVDGHTTFSGEWRWTDSVCARHAWRLCWCKRHGCHTAWHRSPRAPAIGRDGDSRDDTTNSRGRPNESCRSRREQSAAKTRWTTPTSSVTLEHSLQATNMRCAASNSRHVQTSRTVTS